jgi:hypothetical protein
MLQTKIVDKIKAHILYLENFLPENPAVYEIIKKKYCTAGQATVDNMAHAHCMLYN